MGVPNRPQRLGIGANQIPFFGLLVAGIERGLRLALHLKGAVVEPIGDN